MLHSVTLSVVGLLKLKENMQTCEVYMISYNVGHEKGSSQPKFRVPEHVCG